MKALLEAGLMEATLTCLTNTWLQRMNRQASGDALVVAHVVEDEAGQESTQVLGSMDHLYCASATSWDGIQDGLPSRLLMAQGLQFLYAMAVTEQQVMLGHLLLNDGLEPCTGDVLMKADLLTPGLGSGDKYTFLAVAILNSTVASPEAQASLDIIKASLAQMLMFAAKAEGFIHFLFVTHAVVGLFDVLERRVDEVLVLAQSAKQQKAFDHVGALLVASRELAVADNMSKMYMKVGGCFVFGCFELYWIGFLCLVCILCLFVWC